MPIKLRQFLFSIFGVFLRGQTHENTLGHYTEPLIDTANIYMQRERLTLL